MCNTVRMFAAALALGAVPGPGQAQAGGREPAGDTLATVYGTVVELDGGTPLAGAAVSLAAGPGGTPGIGTRITNAEGRFLFQRVRPGTYMVEINLIGYLTRRDTLYVEARTDVRILAKMSVSPVPLEPLLVVARRPPRGPIEGFEDRRKTGLGSFITREQIEKRNPLYVSDLLRMVPGARVSPAGSYGYAVRLRGGCQPDLWVDGVRSFPGVPIDLFLLPMDVEAIEVYRGSELPVRFGASSCGAIVVWTQVPEAGTGKGSFWKRLALALGFLAAGYLLAR